MTIPETLEAGPITLQRWTPDLAGDLPRTVLESMPELVRFMHWATRDHDLDAAQDYLRLSRSEWDGGENFNPASGRVAAKAGFHEVGRLKVEKKAPCDRGTHLVWARRLPQRE